MEYSRVKASLEVINNIEVYSRYVGVSEEDRLKSIPRMPQAIDKVSDDFIKELVEAANTDEINALYEEKIQFYSDTTRSINLLDLAKESYDFISNHWGEIFFILTYLERMGKLDRLKRNPRIKNILDILFEKKIERENDLDSSQKGA